MEAAMGTPTNCHILTNSPALHSLKRQQLIQLCKRTGIKATGRNAEIVEKLKAHARTHPLGRQPFLPDNDDDRDKENKYGAPRTSEVWSVIEEDSREIRRVHLGLNDIREDVEQEMSNMSPLKGFGVNSSGGYGNGTTSSKGSSLTSPIKAFATSLKRAGSKTEPRHDDHMKQSFHGPHPASDHGTNQPAEPTPSIMLHMHTEEPSIFDTLTVTSTPYHEHPRTYPVLPSPQSLDADDSRDQSLLDLGASTIRLVATAPTAPSPPALRPFSPSCDPSFSPGTISIPTPNPLPPVDLDSDPLPPGGFPGVFDTPSNPAKVYNASPQPFLFGSPAHHISNAEFNSAATSVLAEMNARLGLTGTANEINLGLLQNQRNIEPSPKFEMQERPRAAVTSMFDKAHERQFQKMEGLGEWYARRNGTLPGSPGPQETGAGRKRKSDALESPLGRPGGPSNTRARHTSRVVTPGTRRSLLAAAEAEDMAERTMKRVRISAVEGGDKKPAVTGVKSTDESGADEDDEVEKSSKERERERAAIKKKLEISRARRRSSKGRVSVGGGRPPLIPNQSKKGTATKFGFLSSAKSIVKSVWRGVGGAQKRNSTIPVPGPSQKPTPPTTRKTTTSVLTKAAPAAKTSVLKPPVAKTSAAKTESTASLSVPAPGIGLGGMSSTRTSKGSASRSILSIATSGRTRSSSVTSAIQTNKGSTARSISNIATSGRTRSSSVASVIQTSQGPTARSISNIATSGRTRSSSVTSATQTSKGSAAKNISNIAASGRTRASSVTSAAQTSKGSAARTMSNIATSGRTRSSSVTSVIPAARRGPIPPFPHHLSRMSRADSLASGEGTLGSRTSSGGSGSSRGTSANSMGLKRPAFQFGVRASDAGSVNSLSAKRTSTLFAPTASSLAKMQSTIRPPSLLSAASRPSDMSTEPKMVAKVPEPRPWVHGGLSSFTFTSPGSGSKTPSGSIFSGDTHNLVPSQAPISKTAMPKPRAAPAHRPRISRSRVIARVGAQRAVAASSMTHTSSGRRSFNTPKTRGSLGVRVSGIGVKSSARDLAAMSARKRLRQSEILRRRSKLSEVSPALLGRDATPESENGNESEKDQPPQDRGSSMDIEG